MDEDDSSMTSTAVKVGASLNFLALAAVLFSVNLSYVHTRDSSRADCC